MPSIHIEPTTGDDPAFTEVISAFISHYADLYASPIVTVVQIDNWFGPRWLGFAGKFMGAAGMRATVPCRSLPAPPFRPSRVIALHEFRRNTDGTYAVAERPPSLLHVEKNGGETRRIRRPGLYCWFSGSTESNTTGCLMVYDVTAAGSNGWYVMFDRKTQWDVSSHTNVSHDECRMIIDQFRGSKTTEQPFTMEHTADRRADERSPTRAE